MPVISVAHNWTNLHYFPENTLPYGTVIRLVVAYLIVVHVVWQKSSSEPIKILGDFLFPLLYLTRDKIAIEAKKAIDRKLQ